MGTGAQVYKPITDILYTRLSIQEYLQKSSNHSHSQRNKCLLQRLITSTVLLGQ